MDYKFSHNGHTELVFTPKDSLEEALLHALLKQDVVVEKVPGTSNSIVIKPKVDVKSNG